jgi:hypothetical protein
VPTPASNYLSTWPRLILGAHPCILSNTHKGRFPERLLAIARLKSCPQSFSVSTYPEATSLKPYAAASSIDLASLVIARPNGAEELCNTEQSNASKIVGLYPHA